MTADEFAAAEQRIYQTMHPRIMGAIAEQVVKFLDQGLDIYDPESDRSPVGEHVIAWAHSEAERLGFSPEAARMLRADVRVVVRKIIREAVEAAVDHH